MHRAIVLAALLVAAASISHAAQTGKSGPGAGQAVPPAGPEQPAEPAQADQPQAPSEMPAGDQLLYSDVSVEEVATLMRDAGYAAQVKSDDQGPYIESKASGLIFYVNFYGCEGQPPRCRQLQFRASFQTDAEQQQKALQFNVDKVFGRAYNLEDSTYVEHPMHLNGGVTAQNISNNLALWDDVLGGFADYIGW